MSGVRLIDVARRAGVSIASASRSINEEQGVSPEVAARVRQIADSMGYVVNSQARSLASGQVTTIGLIVPAIDDPYFSEIAASVIDHASANQRAVQIAHAGSPEEVIARIRGLRSEKVGAIIMVGSGSEDLVREAEVAKELSPFRDAGGRIVVIGRRAIEASAVLPGNREGGRLVGEHLVSLGHRRVAVVAGPRDLTSVVDRLAGLMDGLGDTQVWLTHHPFTREGGVDGARSALRDFPGATAIAALSDVMAIGVLGELRGRGVSVPKQIAVTGFDDVSVAADLGPSLTTVRLDLEAIGAAALQMTEVGSAQHQSIELQSTLVIRQSTVAS